MIGGFAVGPLPIAMGITMVIQQKMTPSSADPAQQKLMMLMPIIFTFMFLNFASGLVLYWLVNNILSIIQQFHVNRKLAKEKRNAKHEQSGSHINTKPKKINQRSEKLVST